MIKKYRLKRRFLLLSVPLFLIGTLLAFHLNSIFVYSEFKPSIQVKYSLEDQTKLKELIDETTNMQNVSKVDRATSTIEFQNVNLNDIKVNVGNLSEKYDGLTYSVKEVSAIYRGSLSALIAALYILFIAGIAIHFYFIAAKGGKLNIILGSYGIFLLILTDATLLSLGLLSFISRIYKVTALDLLLILISQIIGFFLFYIASNNINDVHNFQFLGITYKGFIQKNMKAILIVLVVLLGLTTVGLGTNFVIHFLLLVVFVIISQFTLFRIGYILENLNNIVESFSSKTTRLRNLRKKKVLASPSQNISKKKDKKKKKKK